MATTRLLLLDANRLLAVSRINRGRLSLEAEFAANEEGLEHFSAWVGAHRKSTFRLIVDVAEEGFVQERVPKLSAQDRAAVIQRRRDQALPGSVWCAASSLGFEAGSERRQETVLFFGIHRAASIEPWVAVLTRQGAALASVHLLAQCAPMLLSSIDKTASRALLILRTASGLRQMFVEGGKLRFSRLAPLPNGERAAQSWLDEADKMRQYLIRERALKSTETLPVFLIGEGAPRGGLPGLACQVVDEATLCARMGLAHPARDLAAGNPALWALAKHPPREQLAPPDARAHHTVRRTRFGLYIASTALAIAAAISSFALMADTQRLIDATPALPPTAASIPATRLPELRALSASIDQLHARSRGPQALLAILSRALDSHPDIELERLDWQTTSGTGIFGEQLTVQGHLANTPADMRAQLDAVNRFHAALQSTSGISAQLTHLPINIEPAKTLRSQDAETIPAGRFTLVIAETLK